MISFDLVIQLRTVACCFYRYDIKIYHMHQFWVNVLLKLRVVKTQNRHLKGCCLQMVITIYWRRLLCSPANPNELLGMELLWAWEPMYSSGAWRFNLD